jgi:hypothetical protein
MVLHGDRGACFAALSRAEDALWLNATVPFKLNDQALEQPALETIYRVLARPTPEDQLRNVDPCERLLFES